MAGSRSSPREPRQVASQVRQRIAEGGERLWRYEDFSDAAVSAVAKALSRLAQQGQLERVSKGVYYRSRQTTFGKSLPNTAAIRNIAAVRKTVFPSGIVAANLLGFTTQTPGRAEVATSGFSLPRKLLGNDTIIHTRRPDAWRGLCETDAGLLDFLRRAGRTSELSPAETVRRTLVLFSERGRFERLLNVARSETAACACHARSHRSGTRQEANCAPTPAGIAESRFAVRVRPAEGAVSCTGLAGEGTGPETVKLFEHPDFEQAVPPGDENTFGIAGCGRRSSKRTTTSPKPCESSRPMTARRPSSRVAPASRRVGI